VVTERSDALSLRLVSLSNHRSVEIHEAGSNPAEYDSIWIASFLAMTVLVARHCEERINPESLIMSIIQIRHYKSRAWEKFPAKKSDDDSGRRHCERSEAIQRP